MTRFDWPALMRAGAALGLRPAEFWALTPAELERMLGGGGGGPVPLGRRRMEELSAAFPDIGKDAT
ncbi:phage tail assembly chaperone [Palleronia sediminis]|uniref:Phage tail assembly chaperone n=1 Tax=Palleronia sediminis TaxID=2547833 RepID=A0A4R6A9B8_9RHOB|nr:rcc01693 family protein [Palleronia sediminis]TDL79557.1 phage tail assembly chaperone [Palleronia sediminis]